MIIFYSTFSVITLSLLLFIVRISSDPLPSTSPLDTEYLYKLYNSTNGLNWEWQQPITSTWAKWNFTAQPVNPCGGWQGVYCESIGNGTQGRVSALLLDKYNLVGTIPRGISEMNFMSAFGLGNNKLGGKIPHELCNMTNLTYLDLGLNLLTGTLPTCFFQTVSSNIAYLSLSSNQLHGPLPNVTNELNMSYLSVQNNHLTGSIPDSWVNMRYMETLYIADNALVGKIDILSNLTNLVYLGISTNSFYGTLPADFSYLDLRGVYLFENYFTSSVPAVWSNLTDLYYMALYENYLTGSLSPSFSAWEHIIIFSIDDNLMSGTLPASFGDMAKIQQMTFYNNKMHGTIPTTIANLRNLQLFLLQENDFSGNLDNVFNGTHQKYLQTVDVSINAFTGQLPRSLFTETLLSFSAFQTCFDGTIPEYICESKNLVTLVLDGITSYCAKDIWPGIPGSPQYSRPVKHEVPECIWRLPNITSLHLSSNDLSGSIPNLESYGNLTNLDLSFNRLVGTIPMRLQNWTKLLNLNLQHNRLVGDIEGMNNLHYTRTSSKKGISLSLSNNRLSGIIPIAILHASNINIVEGNLFSCTAAHQPPYSDPNSANYVCASNMLDISLYCFTAVSLMLLLCVILVFIMIQRQFLQRDCSSDIEAKVDNTHTQPTQSTSQSNATCWTLLSTIYYHSNDTKFLSSTWDVFRMERDAEAPNWYDRYYRPYARSMLAILYWRRILINVRDSQDEEYLHRHGFLTQFLRSVKVLRQIVVIVALFIIIVTVPAYDVLKIKYGTYTDQYRWLISGAFFSGYEPALAVFFIWCVTLLATIYLIDRDIPPKMEYFQDEADDSTNNESFTSETRIPSEFLRNSDNPQSHNTLGRSFSDTSGASDNTSNASNNSQRSAGNSHKSNSSGLRKGSLIDRGHHAFISDSSNNTSSINSNAKSRRSSLRHTLFRATQTVTATVQTSADYWRRPSVWISIIALFINIIVVLAIKAGFIYLLLSSDTLFSFKVLIEMALAAVDLVWSAILVPIIVNRLPKKRATGRMLLKTSMLYFNSIFAPCVVIAVVDTACFNGLFVQAAKVQEEFRIKYCYLLNPSDPSLCENYQSFTTTRYYTPLFIYNYDCYSTVIINYIPIFLISYTTLTLLVPLVSLFVITRKQYWSIFQVLPAVYKADSVHCRDPWLSSALTQSSVASSLSSMSLLSSSLQLNHTTSNNHTNSRNPSTTTNTVINQLHSNHQPFAAKPATSSSNADIVNDRNDRIGSVGSTSNSTAHRQSTFAGGLSMWFLRSVDRTSSASAQDKADDSSAVALNPFRSRSVFFPAFILASAIHHLLVLITFGLLCPSLALGIAVVVCVTTMTWETIIGRWMTQGLVSTSVTSPVHLPETRLQQLDGVCENVCTSPRKCIWILCFGSGAFFAFVLLDMAGDQQGWYHALWAPIAVLLVATGLWLCYMLYEAYGRTPTLHRFNTNHTNNPTANNHNNKHSNSEKDRNTFEDTEFPTSFDPSHNRKIHFHTNNTNINNANNTNKSNMSNRSVDEMSDGFDDHDQFCTDPMDNTSMFRSLQNNNNNNNNNSLSSRQTSRAISTVSVIELSSVTNNNNT